MGNFDRLFAGQRYYIAPNILVAGDVSPVPWWRSPCLAVACHLPFVVAPKPSQAGVGDLAHQFIYMIYFLGTIQMYIQAQVSIH